MEDQIKQLQEQIEELKSKIKDEHVKVSNTPAEDSLTIEEKEEYSWVAPVRVFHKWNRKRITTAILYIIIISLVLIFLKEYPLLITTLLFALVSGALVVLPPQKTKHTITNKGINSFDKLYLWEDLHNYWVSDQQGILVLYVNTKLSYPNHLFFVLPTDTISPLIKAMGRHLKYFERREKQGPVGRLREGRYIYFNDLKNLTSSPQA